MKIKSIKKIKNNQLHYDLQVEKNHNFFANKVLTHNCNLPARNVIILGVTRGISAVDELDIIQMAGRAGRVGFDTEGFCFLICDDKRRWINIISNPRNIESTLLNVGILGFHILAEIKIGIIKDFDSLNSWFARSLAFVQEKWDKELIDLVLLKLVKWKMLVIDSSGFYRITELGRISADLYYLPQDIFHWSIEFYKLNKANLWDSDLAFSWALGSIPSKDLGYVPKDSQDIVREYSFALRKLNTFNVFDSVKAYHLYNAILGNGFSSRVRDFRYDGERIAQALKWIDRISGWKKNEIWNTLPMRLKYGVGRELVELCALPGIGAAKAQKLYSRGIKSLNDVNFANEKQLQRTLGIALADKLLKSVKVEKRLRRIRKVS